VAATAAAAPPHVVPTEVAKERSHAAGGPVELDIYVQDVAGLATILQAAPLPGGDHFRYRAHQYPQVVATGDRSWLEATFVIDHDETDVARLHAEWIGGADTPPTRAGLVEFVSGRMRGSLNRGFDVASVVARRLEGDCTEYAVLTASLARRAGLPARVANGVALIQGPDGPTGMGHAWTEILEDGRWVVADAALLGFPGEVTYLPYGVMEDEGPGYMGELASQYPRWIRKIVVLGNEAGAGAHSPDGGSKHEYR
jgi:transglutaminase-like putative cysteine protease